MTWVRLDDGFYTNKKVQCLSMAARGLWATCASYCGHQLTDGVITARMVRQLGGTPVQIRALIESELWCETSDDSGAKAYAFKDWLEFNPSREDELNRRAREREKKREWREQKAAKQGKRKNVPGGQDAGRDGGRTADVPGVVPGSVPLYPTRPDPTRPDPFINTASSSSNGEQGDGKSASQDFHHPPELGPTVRRLLAAGHDPTVVEAAVAAWDARPAPKGPGLLPHLLADAEATIAAEHAEADRRSAAQARMEHVRRCPLCDETGQIVGDNGAPLAPSLACTHDEDSNAEIILATRQRIEAQEAEEAERRAIAAQAAAEARARWKRDPEPEEGPSGPF